MFLNILQKLKESQAWNVIHVQRPLIKPKKHYLHNEQVTLWLEL